MPVTYHGKRTPDGMVITVTTPAGKTHKLRHINYHSDGFEVGYNGSGPADTALSILAQHFGETWVNRSYLLKLKITQDGPLCLKLHQDFKRDVIARLDRNEWTLTNTDVHNWLMQQEKAEVTN